MARVRPKDPVRIERFRTILQEMGISQYRLAKRIGYSESYMSVILTGKQILTRPLAETICKEFPAYNPEWLLGLSDKKKRK